mgnify:FL=1
MRRSPRPRTRGRSRRRPPPSRALLLASLLLFALPAEGGAQEDSEAIQELLDYSLVENVLDGRADAFLTELRELLGPDVDFASGRVERIVREEFASDRIRGYVAEQLKVNSLPAELEEAAALLRGGAIGRVSDLVARYDPPESFEAFVAGLRNSPPAQERVQLLAEFTDAQQAASLYLLLDETVRRGAHRVASVMTGGGSPPYAELDPAAVRERLQRGRQLAVLSYLHRFRPVEAELLASATADYRTSRGRWFVEAYSLALAESIQLAGLRVAGRLSE